MFSDKNYSENKCDCEDDIAELQAELSAERKLRIEYEQRLINLEELAPTKGDL